MFLLGDIALLKTENPIEFVKGKVEPGKLLKKT